MFDKASDAYSQFKNSDTAKILSAYGQIQGSQQQGAPPAAPAMIAQRVPLQQAQGGDQEAIIRLLIQALAQQQQGGAR